MSGFTINFCPQCGTKLPERAKFCSECGLQLGQVSKTAAAPVKRALNAKHYVGIGLLTLAIWFPAWQLQQWQAGKRPTQPYQQEPQASNMEGNPLEHDPEIGKLEAAARQHPTDLQAQQALASALVGKLRESETPPNQLIFAAMEALSGVLKIKPEDPDALIAMADISFNQQVFGKAADYYSKYLGLEPHDNGARARYASSLSFAGKFDDALKELKFVLEKDPKNFNASAYLAITYAQMGKKNEAISAGEKALSLAPNEEARERFSQFLSEVKNASMPDQQEKSAGPAAKQPATQPAASSGPSAPPAAAGSAATVLGDFVKANPVAGPKFVESVDKGNGVIALYFRAFPMEGMPPFVKDKFVNGIKLKAMDLGVQTILFVDKDSGQEMVKTAVKGNS